VKVLLIVIDAASPRVVCPAIQTGRLPVLQCLADAGTMHQASVTIFPSITPAATTSIITGAYPAEHGIAGAAWYDDAREEVAYYGDDFWVVAREGFGAFVRDFLVRLNGDRLRAPTAFELVEGTGRSAACLNYLVYRGLVPHRARVPKTLAILPGVPFAETVHGPSLLCLGDLVRSKGPRGRRLRGKKGLLHRFGMDDASSGAFLVRLMEGGARPDFTVAYFADNDYRSHEVGPQAALATIEAVDEMLGQAFDAAGGLEALLQDTCVIVTSDHGHCEVLADADRAVIRLDLLLGDFRQAALGRAWQPQDALMICPNMRAAQIYVHEPDAAVVERVVNALLVDPRVDQVFWCTHVTTPGRGGYTAASARGRFEFWRERDGQGGERARDEWGTEWRWRGEPSVLDLLPHEADLAAGSYPNALERVANLLESRNSGKIWVTARPGCEFDLPGGKAHVGGASHGALHALDSLSPLIVAGGATQPDPRRPIRSIDLVPLCLQTLGIPSRYAIGDPRG
jgi:hypothetical protein